PGLDRAVCCFPASPTATSYALSLHDALPIYSRRLDPRSAGGRSGPVPRAAGGRSGPVPPLRRGPLGPCSPAPPGAARALVGYLCRTRAEGRSTMMIETAPSAVHLAASDLPFVDIGGGNKLKVIQVIEKEGLWIIENIFMKGFEVQTHRHTGPVWGYTVSGGWKYKEYDYVNRAGSFLYEPA